MIDLEGIRVRYPGAGSDALAGVSLKIDAGSRTAVMGTNGSGKTTLAHVIASLIQPTDGTVRVEGRVGLVMQNPFHQITSLTVERELAFGLQNTGMPEAELRGKVEDALLRFRLVALRDRSPATLSGGEMQRLALASVLVMEPDVLVLDEATSLLSPGSRSDLLAIVSERSEERPLTLLLVTQFSSEARSCDRLVVLESGGIVRDGSP